jgi:hypothetical protein
MKELSEANIPKTKFKKLMRSAKIMLNMERKVTRKQYESYLRERKEIMDLNLHSDAMYLEEAMEKDLINWLRFLIWKIREGTPLQGHCSLCPNIRIEE